MIDSEAVRKNRPLVRAAFFLVKMQGGIVRSYARHTVEMEEWKRLWGSGDFCKFAEYETLPV